MKRIISLNETMSTAKNKHNEHNLYGQITKHKNQEKISYLTLLKSSVPALASQL